MPVSQQPGVFHLRQSIDDLHGFFNGADAQPFGAGVVGFSLKFHPEEHEAHMGQDQLPAGALAVHHAVCADAVHGRLHGTVTAALLVTHGGDGHVPGQLISRILEKLHRQGGGQQPGLHIRGTQTVQPAVPDGRFMGWGLPVRFIACGHGVDMAVEHDAPAAISFEGGIYIVPAIVVVSQIALVIFAQALLDHRLLHLVFHDGIRAHVRKQGFHVFLPFLLQTTGNAVAQVVGIDGHQIRQLLYILVPVLHQNLFQIPHPNSPFQTAELFSTSTVISDAFLHDVPEFLHIHVNGHLGIGLLVR